MASIIQRGGAWEIHDRAHSDSLRMRTAQRTQPHTAPQGCHLRALHSLATAASQPALYCVASDTSSRTSGGAAAASLATRAAARAFARSQRHHSQRRAARFGHHCVPQPLHGATSCAATKQWAARHASDEVSVSAGAVIAGGGPAGLAAAVALVQGGYKADHVLEGAQSV